MKTINLLYLVIVFQLSSFIAVSQCNTSDYTFSYQKKYNCTYNAGNSVSVYEQLEFYVESNFSGSTVTLKKNGTTFDTYQLTSSVIIFKDHYFDSPGIYNITASISHPDCSGTITISIPTITVVDESCPTVTVKNLTYSQCSFPGGSTSLILSPNSSSATILSSDWSFSNGESATFNGTSFSFTPNLPGYQMGNGQALVELADNSTCIAPIVNLVNSNTLSCDIFLGDYRYSDPSFTAYTNGYTNSPIDIIYTGNQNFPSDVTYTHKLYINNVLQGTYTGLQENQLIMTYTPTTAGNYTIKLVAEDSYRICLDELSTTFTITNAPSVTQDPETCLNCNTFYPTPGNKYWVSAWVKESSTVPVKTYTKTSIEIEYLSSGGTVLSTEILLPEGDLVEGWQRISQMITIPSNAYDIRINLKSASNSTVDSYFDDIRVHPFNSSMKSYVYDQETYLLTAELDDNNYATFYEYDKEGQLIRIKKETARGIMTIQESRMNNPKN